MHTEQGKVLLSYLLYSRQAWVAASSFRREQLSLLGKSFWNHKTKAQKVWH